MIFASASEKSGSSSYADGGRPGELARASESHGATLCTATSPLCRHSVVTRWVLVSHCTQSPRCRRRAAPAARDAEAAPPPIVIDMCTPAESAEATSTAAESVVAASAPAAESTAARDAESRARPCFGLVTTKCGILYRPCTLAYV